MEINKELLETLFAEAKENLRLRQNYDLRTSSADTSQRMLNALLPGKLDEVIYEEVVSYENDTTGLSQGMDTQNVFRKVSYREVQRIRLCPAEAKYGCQIPKGTWHTVEVIDPSVIFEAKDGAYQQ